MMHLQKSPKGQHFASDGYAILNAQGEPWTPQWFITEHEARRYLSRTKRSEPKWDLSKHTIVPARFTVKPSHPNAEA